MEKMKVLKNEFEVNLKKKFHLSSLHYVATFLHPQLKHLPFLSLTDLKSTVEDVKKILVTSGIADTNRATEEPPAKVSKSVVDEFAASGTNRDEIEKYKDYTVLNCDDVLKWWSKQEDLPTLPGLSQHPKQQANDCFPPPVEISKNGDKILIRKTLTLFFFIKDMEKLNKCSEVKLTHCFDFLIINCGAVRLRI